jgi:hypothetical protein
VIVVIAALIILRWLHRRQKARTEALLAEKLPDSRVD